MATPINYNLKEDSTWFSSALGVVILFVIFGGAFFLIFTWGKECEENKRQCRRYEKQIQCEDLGGIYYSGGAFSTPNCVFPPTK